MGTFFVWYYSKRFKIGHNYCEHTDDISTLNNKEIALNYLLKGNWYSPESGFESYVYISGGCYNPKSIHYNFKNYILQKTAMNSINIIEHKIYTFHIHSWFTSHRPSHFITQFNVVWPSEQRKKLSVSFPGSRPPKLAFSITIKQSVRFGLIAVENDSLEDPVCSRYPLLIIHNFPI